MDPSNIDGITKQHDEECKTAVSAFKRDVQKLRTGRASAGMLEGIHVDYYGSRTPLQHLAQISSPEPRLIVVQVYDTQAIDSVDKAIRGSELGFNPSREGNTLRINVPPLTEETKKDIVRHLHKHAEEIRVSIRNHRRDSNELIKKLEKNSQVTKDEAKRGMDKIQKQTDFHIEQVDKNLAAKEADYMEV